MPKSQLQLREEDSISTPNHNQQLHDSIGSNSRHKRQREIQTGESKVLLDGSLEMSGCLERNTNLAQRGRPHDSQGEDDVDNVDDDEAGE